MSKNLRAYVLLDRSGSMTSKWAETLTSINAYASELAKSEPKARLTFAAFDHHAGFQFEVIRDAVRAQDWEPVTDGVVSPRGITPLFDAIGHLVAMAEKQDPKKAVIVVVTDGLENASGEYTRDAARSKLDRCRERGWQVVFLGADFDAMPNAGMVGVGQGQTLNMTAGNYRSATTNLAAATVAYAQRGQGISFTDEDRKAAGKAD